MINDIFHFSPLNQKHSIYADDVAFWVTRDTPLAAYSRAQIILNDIVKWCEEWGLKLSRNKTAALLFVPPRLAHDKPPSLKIKDKPINYVNEFTYLGITLDKTLNFNKHFENIKSRCSRRINILKCITGKDWGADRRTLFQLYTSLIRPILDYNAFLFDDIASKKIESLQIIQNNALRIITGAHATTSIIALHAECNIPFLRQRRKLQLLRFFARACSSPNQNTHKIVTNRYQEGHLSSAQTKYPVIAYRIELVFARFQIPPPKILPTPPASSFYIPPFEGASFLFSSNKRNTLKEECLQLFHKYKANHTGYTFYYTDGSKKGPNTAAAVYSEVYQKSYRVHDHHSIFTAELSGILAALKHVTTSTIEKAVICTDSASAIMAIKTRRPEPNRLVHNIKKQLYKLGEGKDIKLLWIPGHLGIPGNEAADKLAKDALNLPPRNHLERAHTTLQAK
ncbi:uncharacterized protein LOC122392598 [Amphibalanus amphitrite]|uniref:uncharacterized protein LOC122392598 n=1 Tax=Amphibalanus amphitrite TaxID=1232801 RepID=UPI001C926E16|nr:uncharacterized protein LOC122392598 [Amphibalanus amphitrite]